MKNRKWQLVIKIISFGIFFLLTIPAVAATHYVGSGDLFTTIQSAVDEATCGDTIIVKDGTYSENLVVDKALTVQSENGYLSSTVIAYDSALDGIRVTADHVTISGFTVYGANSRGKAGILLDGVNGGLLANNRCGYEKVKGNYYGIELSGATACKVENNTCNYDSWFGFFIHNLSSSNLITGNQCSHNFVSEIFVDIDGNGISVISNTCTGHLISGISEAGVGNSVKKKPVLTMVMVLPCRDVMAL